MFDFFISILQVPIIEYGNWNELEVESFIVISSLNAYIYRVTAPERYTGVY